MSVDGFLMGNLGITTEVSSAQMASRAEHNANKESEIKIKDLNEAEKDGGVKAKTDEERNSQQEFEDGFRKNNNSDDDELQSHLTEEEIENSDPKEFSIRINSKTEKVELINNKSGNIVESIKAQDLMQVMSRLDNASGILVNRKI